VGYFFCLLSPSKSAVETSLNVAELIIIVSGLALAFGAIGEYLEEHSKLPRWMGWPKLVFIILVVTSLIGEFLGDAGVFVFSRQLQKIEGAEISDLDVRAKGAVEDATTALRNADDAKRKAGDASTAASQAKGAADNAKTTASDAAGIARDARRELASVNEGVAAARKGVAELEMELASVQHGLTLRLDREAVFVSKRGSFENAVKAFGGQKVDVRYAANLENPNNPYDPETYWFALQLHFSLLQARWLSPAALRDVPAEHGTGVFISVSARSSKATRDAAEALAAALVAVPIEVRPALQGSGTFPGSLVSLGQLPPRIPQPEIAMFAPLDDETIVVEVAPHP